jgi:arylsulfatase A-like enzyme
MSYYTLHLPENALKSSLARFEKKPAGNTHHDPARAAITYDLDTGVGCLLDAITELGLDQNTYVIYMADNGGGGGKGGKGQQGKLHGGKGGLWEGGIRVPFIVRGPGIVPNSWCHQPVVGYDLFPTFCHWAGVKEKLPEKIDGGDLMPLLMGGKDSVRRADSAMLFHFPHYQGAPPQSSIRDGDLKLIISYENHARQLYDLSKDIAEQNDLAASRKEDADRLEAELRARLTECGAKLPQPNPAYDPAAAPPTRRHGKQGKDGKDGTPNKKNRSAEP